MIEKVQVPGCVMRYRGPVSEPKGASEVVKERAVRSVDATRDQDPHHISVDADECCPKVGHWFEVGQECICYPSPLVWQKDEGVWKRTRTGLRSSISRVPFSSLTEVENLIGDALAEQSIEPRVLSYVKVGLESRVTAVDNELKMDKALRLLLSAAVELRDRVG